MLFVLTRRFFSSLPPEPGERQGRAGWARPAAPSPWSRGPEAPRLRAHPTALWSFVGRGIVRSGVGERGKWCIDFPCASGRGRWSGSARKYMPGGLCRGAPGARPRPASRQSTGLSAIDRFPRSAMPFLITSLCPDRGGETPVSLGEGASVLQCSFSPGSPLSCRPEPPGPGWSSPLLPIV